MPVSLNLAASLAMGAGLVHLTRRSPALRGTFCSWQLLLLLGFEALVVTPACTLFFRFYPDHALLYALDPQIYGALEAHATALSALAAALNFAALVGGYASARHGVRRGQGAWVALPLLAAGLLAGLTVCAAAPGLVRLGSYDAFWAGEAPLLLGRAAGWAGLACYLAMAGLPAWAARHFAAHDPDPFAGQRVF